MAAVLNLDRDLVVGKVLRFWDWVTEKSSNGSVSVTVASRSRHGRVTQPSQAVTDECAVVADECGEDIIREATACPGLAKALVEVGWLRLVEGGFEVPEYDEWLSQAAADRDYAAERSAEYRARLRASGARHGGVTESSQSDTDTENNKRANARLSRASQELPLKNIKMSFPTKSGDPWHLSEEEFQTLLTTFPGTRVEEELRKALVWLQGNPSRAKTARGMSKFLFGWLNRSCASPGPSQRPAGLFADRATPEELLEQIKRKQGYSNQEGLNGDAGSAEKS